MEHIFNGVTIRLGDELHDQDGNVIGKVESFKMNEHREIVAIHSINDGRFIERLVPQPATRKLSVEVTRVVLDG